MPPRMSAPMVRFEAALLTIDGSTILRLPRGASETLKSRGEVAGTLNGHEFQTVLEPDGYFGHWMRLGDGLRRTAGLRAGDTAEVVVEPLTDWPEPAVPADLDAALSAAPQRIRDLWKDITPM